MMNTCPVEAVLFHMDGQTDGRMDGRTDRYDQANSHFLQFCKHM